MKKILVIGSSGYIGKSLIKSLKKKYKLILPSHSKGKIDVLNKKTLKRYISKDISNIINLTGQNDFNKKRLKKVIVQGNKNLIEIINKVNPNINYIFISTCLVYGFKKNKALENSKLSPVSFYAKLKYKVENYLKKNALNYHILRLANVYDESLNNGFFKKFFSSLKKEKKIYFSNIKTKRNMVHMQDAVKAMIIIIKSPKKKLIINIGNENIELSKIKILFKRFLNNKIEIVENKMSLNKDSSQMISIEKLNKLAKWKKKNIKSTLNKILKKYEKSF